MNSDRISLFKQFIKEEPANPFNKYALAMEYYETQPEESLSLLRSLLADHPDYLPTYFKAAHLLWESESWDDADEVFQKGIKLAEEQKDQKALQELKAAYLNFEFDRD
ncbi:tetratricopeptide repeat protein [Ekhidna sp.]|jgi:tetratricopeptide (TPR) repeat protein|uniref:tetratricopeptide repeat protein n=1 Tax=Ekhidna sp. TaxID=2608089 RepID=UPI0032EA9849